MNNLTAAYWKSIAVSAIGTSHVNSGKPCQDFAKCRWMGEALVGAVSDGAGSAPLSHIGAQLACETAILYLEGQKELFFVDENDLRTRFRELMEAIQHLFKTSSLIRQCGMTDLASTLIAFVGSPDGLVAMQMGDGILVARWQGEDSYSLLFEPEHGEYVNQTVFVTSPKAMDCIKVGVWRKAPEFLCASTDGLEKLAIDYRTSKPHDPFFRPLEAILMGKTAKGIVEMELETFLHSEAVNQRVDDDKTLLLGVLNEAGEDQLWAL